MHFLMKWFKDLAQEVKISGGNMTYVPKATSLKRKTLSNFLRKNTCAIISRRLLLAVSKSNNGMAVTITITVFTACNLPLLLHRQTPRLPPLSHPHVQAELLPWLPHPPSLTPHCPSPLIHPTEPTALLHAQPQHPYDFRLRCSSKPRKPLSLCELKTPPLQSQQHDGLPASR